MPTILVAEDEAHILRVIAMWLSRHGYDILEAVDGDAALEMVDRETVDMIISDMNMPGINGLELVRIIREERRMDVPMMLLTARCDRENLARQIEPYDVHVCAKPFMPSRLVADVDRLLNPLRQEG